MFAELTNNILSSIMIGQKFIVNLAYAIIAFAFATILTQFVEKKYNLDVEKSNLRNNRIFAVVAATYPFLIDLGIVIFVILNKNLNSIWLVNNLAWGHVVIPVILSVIFIPWVGIGKWKWQTTVQIILWMIIFHMFCDFIFYSLPIYFTAPIYNYELLEYGENLFPQIDNLTFPYLSEIVFLIISLVMLFALILKGKKNLSNM